MKRHLLRLGLVVEDVLEAGQSPSTYTEPDEVLVPDPNAMVGILTTMGTPAV